MPIVRTNKQRAAAGELAIASYSRGEGGRKIATPWCEDDAVTLVTDVLHALRQYGLDTEDIDDFLITCVRDFAADVREEQPGGNLGAS